MSGYFGWLVVGWLGSFVEAFLLQRFATELMEWA